MSRFPSLPLFTDAFIADTGHLTAQETGAYLMLLMMAWRMPSCALPDDDAKLARWARVDARTWRRVKPVVMEFWTFEDGFWRQARLTKERETVSKRAEAARENGQRGGRPNSLENNNAANPVGCSRDTHRKAPNPISNNTPISPEEDNAKTVDFEGFWKAYPKRDGANPRKPAQQKYDIAIRDGADPEAILRGVKAYVAELERNGKSGTEYVMQAKRFLDQEVWREYDRPAVADAKPGKASIESISDDQWRRDVKRYVEHRYMRQWIYRDLTLPPDHPETLVPRHILAEFDLPKVRRPPDTRHDEHSGAVTRPRTASSKDVEAQSEAT